jgi:uncharacterized protein (TIGR02145 family)
MKSLSLIFKFAVTCFLVFIFSSCDDDNSIPRITTSDVVEISATGAISGGEEIYDGGTQVLKRGICWDDTSAFPTIENSNTIDDYGEGSFACTLTQLIPNSFYYVRAYATNSVGTGYGLPLRFKTLGNSPLAVTYSATNIKLNSAYLSGSVCPNYLPTSAVFEYGTTESYGDSIIAEGTSLNGGKMIDVGAELSGLKIGTLYNYRIKAVNELGTIVGKNMYFVSLRPMATTLLASDVSLRSATLNGTVKANGTVLKALFQYGREVPESHSVSYYTTVNAIPLDITDDTDTFVSTNISGLLPGKTYLFRIKIETDIGIFFSSDSRFTTVSPSLTTGLATKVLFTSVTLNSVVNPNGDNILTNFRFWKTNSTVQTINAVPHNVSGSLNTNVTAYISGLEPSTKYYYQVSAASDGWAGTGIQRAFTTKGLVFNPELTYQTVSDVEDNIYNTIQIGTQIWMAENLKATRYNDGTALSEFTTTLQSEIGAYRWDGSFSENISDYGYMYNWYSINSNKLCPTGWHVPTMEEFTILINYLGGQNIAGGKLKETGSTHWYGNFGADNSSGFTAVGAGNNEDMAGLTDPWGSHWNFKSLGYYWSKTDYGSVLRLESSSIRAIFTGYSKKYYCSVRCLKD